MLFEAVSLINVVCMYLLEKNPLRLIVSETGLMAARATVFAFVYTMLPSSGLFYGSIQRQSTKTFKKRGAFLKFIAPLPLEKK